MEKIMSGRIHYVCNRVYKDWKNRTINGAKFKFDDLLGTVRDQVCGKSAGLKVWFTVDVKRPVKKTVYVVIKKTTMKEYTLYYQTTKPTGFYCKEVPFEIKDGKIVYKKPEYIEW